MEIVLEIVLKNPFQPLLSQPDMQIKYEAQKKGGAVNIPKKKIFDANGWFRERVFKSQISSHKISY